MLKDENNRKEKGADEVNRSVIEKKIKVFLSPRTTLSLKKNLTNQFSQWKVKFNQNPITRTEQNRTEPECSTNSTQKYSSDNSLWLVSLTLLTTIKKKIDLFKISKKKKKQK